jgi:hypothetical protein
MRNLFCPLPTRTWNGPRIIFALLTLLFLGIVGWLVLHERMLQHEARLLLLIPLAFCLGFGLCALFAPDYRLRVIFNSISF